MEIKSRIVVNDGAYEVIYRDADSFDVLDYEKVKQTYGVCFCGDKIAVVHNARADTWGLVGGSMEKGEKYEDCLAREVLEESNMKIIFARPVGYQEVKEGDKTIYQLRYVCEVEPAGNFVADPAGAIDKMLLIGPNDYKQYFDWGEIGDRIMERALELKGKLYGNSK